MAAEDAPPKRSRVTYGITTDIEAGARLDCSFALTAGITPDASPVFRSPRRVLISDFPELTTPSAWVPGPRLRRRSILSNVGISCGASLVSPIALDRTHACARDGAATAATRHARPKI